MNIASLLFMMTLMSIFATGILMLLVLTKRNRLQLTLAGILGVCLILMFMGFLNMIQSPVQHQTVLSSPLRFRFLALGLIAFFATMTYYMVASHRNLLTLRGSILFLSPVLLTLVVYVLWHWKSGVPMDYPYASLREVWENRFTVPVILRVLLYLFFLIYQGVMFRSMWHLDAMRNEHSILNSPDAVSNIRWLRMVVVGIMSITVSYSLMMFIPSFPILVIHILVMASVFIYFIYNALARPMYEDIERYQAVWTLRDGLKIIEGTSQAKPKETVGEPEAAIPIEELNSATPNYIALIEQWMKKEKPFCSTDFSTSDIIAQFPKLTNETLNELLKKAGSSPQAFIRRHRIEEACRIIRLKTAIKVVELAAHVGFSHASSFSRAFSAVMGETVLEYMGRVGAKRKPNNNAKKKNNKTE